MWETTVQKKENETGNKTAGLTGKSSPRKSGYISVYQETTRRKREIERERFLSKTGIYKNFASVLVMILTLSLPICSTGRAETGKATYYTVQSVLAEGNSGITAAGKKFQEESFTVALRSRQFGQKYRITNLRNGKSVVVEHSDFGPGKGPTSRGVICDLSPAAFDALGGKRGVTKSGIAWGELNVEVEPMGRV